VHDGGLVSVVIPCYNHARFLDATITSVLEQTYQPIEIIVVDDGSTDESARVAARHPVRVLRQSNQGVAAAMNTGLAAARGTFFSTLGSDDLMHPLYVEACMGALMTQPGASFAYTQMTLFGAVHRLYPGLPFHPETLAENDYVPAAFVMRRSAFDEVGPFDAVIPRCEDWDLLLSMAEHGMWGVFIPQPLFFYRQHRKSYNSHDFLSLHGLRRELAMAARLQDRHPRLLAPKALRRRLLRLPERLASGEVTPRHAALLVAFYGAMLARPLIPGASRKQSPEPARGS
jgi:glycosyltransferase involved in cell wall biosynthesis